MIYRGLSPQCKQQQMEANLGFLKTRCLLSKFSNRQQGACSLGTLVEGPSVFVLLSLVNKEIVLGLLIGKNLDKQERQN